MIMRSFQRLWEHFLNDDLFRNSIYLMATTLVMSALGFFFWLICAHIFTPGQIGVGTALISAMTLISFMSLLGFNSTFVRILPNSQDRDKEINTGSTLVISTAAILAIVYVWLVPFIAPKLGIIHENFWYAAGFVIAVSLSSINSLTDSIFIAYRSAQYNLITDGFITSGVKLFLPLIFIGLGAYGVFAAAGLGVSMGMVASILFLVIKFNYKPQIRIDILTLKKVFNYSFANYIANFLNIVPTLILPIIVIDHLGAPTAAYYYLAFTVIGLLNAIGISISQSLFAEGSRDEFALRSLVKKSAITLVVIMIPAAFIFAIFGPFILGFFGKSYSEGGAGVIVLLALAAPITAAYAFGTVLLRIAHQVYSLVLVNIVYAAIISGLAFLWVDKGLSWVAIAWIVGNLIATILAFFFIGQNRHWRISANTPSIA